MRSRTWGIIAVLALILAAVLLGITLIGQQRPEASVSLTPTAVREQDPTASPSPIALPTPATAITYSVQAGDTLSAIAQEHEVSLEALIAANDLADPDVLQVGQILTIPPDAEDASAGPPSGNQPTMEPSVDVGNVSIPPTLTPGGPSLVEISEAVGIGTLESETITLSNQGGMVSLEDWTLSSTADEQFIFPALTLFPGGKVRVHSATGDDTPQDLYWDRTEPAWIEGELITLRDADGNVVDTYIVME